MGRIFGCLRSTRISLASSRQFRVRSYRNIKTLLGRDYGEVCLDGVAHTTRFFVVWGIRKAMRIGLASPKPCTLRDDFVDEAASGFITGTTKIAANDGHSINVAAVVEDDT